MHPLLEKQNDKHLITLLKAATVCYTRAKLIEVAFLRLMFLLALSYPLAHFYFRNEMLVFGISIFAFLFTISVSVLSVFIKKKISDGALYKESFDAELFGLPWKSTVKKPDLLKAENLALAHKNSSAYNNWYPVTIAEWLPNEVAIAACLRVNAGWDVNIRNAFLAFLYGVLSVFSLLLFIVCIIFSSQGFNILPVIFGSLSFYLYFINQIQGHKTVIGIREKIASMLDDELLDKHNIPQLQFLRDIQDDILATRQVTSTVPNFYYRLFRNKHDLATSEFIAEINNVKEWK